MVLVLALGGAVGCAEELGPERTPTTAIAGRVKLRDRPLGGGWLEIMPDGGTLGRLRSARFGPDGSFRAEGVPIGPVVIRLVAPRSPRTGDPGLDRFLEDAGRRYLIGRDTRDEPGRMLIDLEQEYRRFRRGGS